MTLSEMDLLLLDCFMYSDLAPKTPNGTSVSKMVEQFVDPKTGEISLQKIKERNLDFSGDMDAEKFKDVLEEMRKSDAIMNLELAKTSPEYYGSIRAACFVDEDTDKATVAFRGTGGSYKQWLNNFEGYGDLYQQSQKDAENFINSLPYDDIDVTGHSNGGDQAMYVTIVCGDKISRCVAYEGQGVSKEFVNEYADEIDKNKYKIKNICGQNDPVGLLLINIAGETVYVKSGKGILNAIIGFDHGAYGILTANRKALKDNGGYFPESSYVEQPWQLKLLHEFTVWLAEHSDTPFVGRVLEFGTDVLGIIIAMVISGKIFDPEYIYKAFEDLVIAIRDLVYGLKEDVINVIEDIRDNVIEWVAKTFGLSNGAAYATEHPQITVDTYKLTTYADRITAVNSRVTSLESRLDSLYWKVGLLGLWDLMQADFLTSYSIRLRGCANYLNETAEEFENVENDLISKLE